MTLLFLILSLPVYAVGLLVFWHVARPQHSPADASNRINKLRLVWFALTREELFVNVLLCLCPWHDTHLTCDMSLCYNGSTK